MSKERSKRELLHIGFSRQYCDRFIPKDLISLFIRFADDAITWQLSAQEIEKFWLGKTLQSKRFNVDNFKMVAILEPFGYNEDTDGFVTYSFKILSGKTKQIKAVNFYYEMRCVEMNKFWRASVQWNGENETEYIWNPYILPISEMVGQNKTLKTLTFTHKIKILGIEYKDHWDEWVFEDKWLDKRITIDSFMIIEWWVDFEEVKPNGVLYSPLVIGRQPVPFYCYYKRDGKFGIFFSIFPAGVSKIAFRFTLRQSNGENSFTFNDDVTCGFGSSIIKNICPLTFEIIEPIFESKHVVCVCRITGIYSQYGEIPKNEWNDYGIIQNVAI